MLPKPLRLDSKLIPMVARKGRRLGNELVDIRLLGGSDFTSPKFAIVTSKKLSGSAVVRNRIRRRLRAALLELQSQGKLRSGLHLIMPRSTSLEDLELDQLIDL